MAIDPKTIEYSSDEKRFQSEKKVYIEILKNQDSIMINGVTITNEKQLERELRLRFNR